MCVHNDLRGIKCFLSTYDRKIKKIATSQFNNKIILLMMTDYITLFPDLKI